MTYFDPYLSGGYLAGDFEPAEPPPPPPPPGPSGGGYATGPYGQVPYAGAPEGETGTPDSQATGIGVAIGYATAVGQKTTANSANSATISSTTGHGAAVKTQTGSLWGVTHVAATGAGAHEHTGEVHYHAVGWGQASGAKQTARHANSTTVGWQTGSGSPTRAGNAHHHAVLWAATSSSVSYDATGTGIGYLVSWATVTGAKTVRRHAGHRALGYNTGVNGPVSRTGEGHPTFLSWPRSWGTAAQTGVNPPQGWAVSYNKAVGRKSMAYNGDATAISWVGGVPARRITGRANWTLIGYGTANGTTARSGTGVSQSITFGANVGAKHTSGHGHFYAVIFPHTVGHKVGQGAASHWTLQAHTGYIVEGQAWPVVVSIHILETTMSIDTLETRTTINTLEDRITVGAVDAITRKVPT